MTLRERRGPLTISMIFCLGEWAMNLGPTVLLRVYQGKPLLMTLFTVSKERIIVTKNFLSKWVRVFIYFNSPW